MKKLVIYLILSCAVMVTMQAQEEDTVSFYPLAESNVKIYNLPIDQLFDRIYIPCIWLDTVEQKGIFKKILLVVDDDLCCDDTLFEGIIDIEIVSNKLKKNGTIFCQSAAFYEDTMYYELSRSNPKDAVVLKKFDALMNKMNYFFCDYAYMLAE